MDFRQRLTRSLFKGRRSSDERPWDRFVPPGRVCIDIGWPASTPKVPLAAYSTCSGTNAQCHG
eukprot:5228602-Pyramimonas_sp.AAC.1